MAQWAPIIFGRTFEVDFRLLVKPTGFTNDKWAIRHIQDTFEAFAASEQDIPRWSMFRNERYCTIGVTCKVSLLGDIAIGMDKDRVGRPLHVFLGYVSMAPFPILPPRDMTIFRELYRFVQTRWMDKSWNGDTITESDYTVALPECEPQLAPQIELNTNSMHVAVYSRQYNDELWAAAALPGDYPLSLCLDLARQRNAKEGLFFNASSFDIIHNMVLLDHPTIPQPAPKPQPVPAHPEQQRPMQPANEAIMYRGYRGRSDRSQRRGSLLEWVFNTSKNVIYAISEPFIDLLTEHDTPPNHSAQPDPSTYSMHTQKHAQPEKRVQGQLPASSPSIAKQPEQQKPPRAQPEPRLEMPEQPVQPLPNSSKQSSYEDPNSAIVKYFNNQVSKQSNSEIADADETSSPATGQGQSSDTVQERE